MIKIYCDKCGKEIDQDKQSAMTVTWSRVKDVVDGNMRPDVIREIKTLCTECSDEIWKLLQDTTQPKK